MPGSGSIVSQADLAAAIARTGLVQATCLSFPQPVTGVACGDPQTGAGGFPVSDICGKLGQVLAAISVYDLLPGPVGPTGPIGPIGASGPAGIQGIAGLIGPLGRTGPIGPEGIAGIPGPIGPIGDVFSEASNPAGWAELLARVAVLAAQEALLNPGPIGPIGPIGETGETGEPGEMGEAGEPGIGEEIGVDSINFPAFPSTAGSLNAPVLSGRRRPIFAPSAIGPRVTTAPIFATAPIRRTAAGVPIPTGGRPPRTTPAKRQRGLPDLIATILRARRARQLGDARRRALERFGQRQRAAVAAFRRAQLSRVFRAPVRVPTERVRTMPFGQDGFFSGVGDFFADLDLGGLANTAAQFFLQQQAPVFTPPIFAPAPQLPPGTAQIAVPTSPTFPVGFPTLPPIQAPVGTIPAATGFRDLAGEFVAGTACAPLFKPVMGPKRARPASLVIQANPTDGRPEFFGSRGQPVLFSGDFAAVGRVDRAAKRARKALGSGHRRRPR